MDTATHPLTGTYQRHEPEHSLLYQVLAEHLETFLQQARTSDHALPWYGERDRRAFLDGGILQHGFPRRRPLIRSPASAALSGGKHRLNQNRYPRCRRSNPPNDPTQPAYPPQNNLDRGF